MKRNFALIFLSFFLWPLTCQGDIYVASDFDGFDSGWSFDGGFYDVQSGFSGDVTFPEIRTIIPSYSLSFTSPAGSYTLNESNSNLFYSGNITNRDLRITSEVIEFPEEQDTFDTFFARSNTGSLLSIEFLTPGPIGNQRPSMFLVDFNIASGGPTSQTSNSHSNPERLVIATAVPEPNVAMLFYVAIALVTPLRRHKRVI